MASLVVTKTLGRTYPLETSSIGIVLCNKRAGRA